MKIRTFIIFITIVLLAYFIVNYYIFIHGLKAFGTNQTAKLIYTILFVILVSAYFLGRIIERISIGVVPQALEWLGAYWFGAMVYFLLIVIMIDIFRVINHFIPLIPNDLRQYLQQLSLITGIVAVTVVAIILVIGRWNATHPQIKIVEIDIQKKAKVETMTVAFASDIHLGLFVGQRQLRQLVELINANHPDVILFGGDLLDEDLTPVINRNLGRCLAELEAPLGKLTVPGNHEFIGGIEKATQYLENHGIKVLRDEALQLANGVWIIGRDDYDSKRYSSDVQRLTLKYLIDKINPDQPIIVLDHQPLNLSESIASRIDLQLSGHTHNGQLWPLNYLTAKVYQVSHGYKNIDGTHFIVSSGFGTWGPPIRLASRSEVYLIKLRFQPDFGDEQYI
ncbi:MAG TPA: metallophosphoesterase [Candidatus Marinimicrobia bacterium]|nr:metallophosphoesterase [Candidatus Neomarinimicrobiota bacterium]